MLETKHQNAIIIGVAALILVLFYYFMFRGKDESAAQTAKEQDALSALQRVKGDQSKLSAEEKMKLDEALNKNPRSSAGRYRPGANPGIPSGKTEGQ